MDYAGVKGVYKEIIRGVEEMTDTDKTITNYHSKRIEQAIISLRQIVSDMVEDGILNSKYVTIATIVHKARKPLEEAKRELEKLRENGKRIDSEADWTRGITQEIEMSQVDIIRRGKKK